MVNRSVHKNLGVIRVLDHSAKGDGVTDDTAAFQSAFAAAQARTEDAIVYVDPGNYVFAAPATGAAVFDYAALPNFYLEGAGDGLTKLSFIAPNTRARILSLTDSQDVSIKGINFDGNVGNNTIVQFNGALDIRGCRRVRIHENIFSNTGDLAVRISRQGSGSGGDSILPQASRIGWKSGVYDNHFINNYGDGGVSTSGAGSNYLWIRDNTFFNQGTFAISCDSGITSGTDNYNSGQICVVNNFINGVNGSDRGITLHSYGIGAVSNVRNIIIQGNEIFNVEGGNESSGILLDTGETEREVRNIIVQGNIIERVVQSSGNLRGSAFRSKTRFSKIYDVNIANNIINNSYVGLHFELGDYPGPPYNPLLQTQSSVQPVNINGNNITAHDSGILTTGGTNSAVAGFSRPLDMAMIGNNTITAGNDIGNWRGVRAFFLRGNIVGNMFFGKNYTGSVGVEWLDDVNSPSVFSEMRKWVNSNSFHGVTTDYANSPGAVHPHQVGTGYVWIDSTGDHRTKTTMPTGATAAIADQDGTVTGVQT